VSQKDNGKQSNNIHRQKRSKIQNNRKIKKSLQVAQKRGTEIIQVLNPPDPLKSSNGEKSIKKAGFVLLRLLAQEAGNHGLKTFNLLILRSLKLVMRKLTSSKQLVCKINEEIHH
jgi:hypothetical protein